MGNHVPYGITQCYLPPSRVTFPPLPQPIKASTRFSDPGGMQGWVYLVGLVTYWGGTLAQRRSPIPILTGLNVPLCQTANTATPNRHVYSWPVVKCNKPDSWDSDQILLNDKDQQVLVISYVPGSKSATYDCFAAVRCSVSCFRPL